MPAYTFKQNAWLLHFYNLKSLIKRSFATLLSLLMAALMLTACGGGSDGTESGSFTIPRITTIDIVASKTTLTAGEKIQLTGIGVYSNGNREDRVGFIRWSTSDSSIADVSLSGQLTAKSPGTVVVTAHDYSLINASDSTKTFTIIPSQPTGVQINGFNSGKLTYSSTDLRTLTAKIVYPEGVKDPTGIVTWNSSNPSVATVDSAGVFRAIAPGSTVITAQAQGFQKAVSISIVAADSKPIVIYCSRLEQLTLSPISISDWNARYTKDPDNSAEWVKVDYASCKGLSNVSLNWRAPEIGAEKLQPVTLAENANTFSRFTPVVVYKKLSETNKDLIVGENDLFNGVYTYSEFTALP